MMVPRIFAWKAASAMLALPLLLGAAAPTEAPRVLSLPAAVELALRDQPRLSAFEARAQAAREAAVAAGVLPDPKLTAGVQNLPVTRSDAFDFTADEMTMATVGVMREMVRKPKREAASAVALSQGAVSAAEATVARREIERSVSRAWIDAVEAEQAVSLHQELIDAITARIALMETGVSTGRSSAADVLALKARLAKMQGEQAIEHGKARAARASLARWLGQGASLPLPKTIPDWTPPLPRAEAERDLVDHAVLALARQRTQVAELGVAAAKANQLSDWSWSVVYGHRFGDRSDMLSAQVAISLPINRKGLQDRRVMEQATLASASLADAQDSWRELDARFNAAWETWQAGDLQVRNTANSVIPALDARAKVLEAGYGVGAEPVDRLIEDWEQITETSRDLLRQDADRARAAVELQYFIVEKGQ